MTGAVLTPSAAAQRQKADRLSIADCNCYSQQNSQILELMVPAVSRPRRYDEARPMRLFSSLPGGATPLTRMRRSVHSGGGLVHLRQRFVEVKVAFVQRLFARFSFSEHPI
jgi:hypothetical protein